MKIRILFTAILLTIASAAHADKWTEISVNGSEPQIIPYTGLELAPQSVYDFTLPEYTSTSTGDVDLSIKVKNINGADDNDTSDNTQSEPVFFYPANMEQRCPHDKLEYQG